jgi:hypothetical protein
MPHYFPGELHAAVVSQYLVRRSWARTARQMLTCELGQIPIHVWLEGGMPSTGPLVPILSGNAPLVLGLICTTMPQPHRGFTARDSPSNCVALRGLCPRGGATPMLRFRIRRGPECCTAPLHPARTPVRTVGFLGARKQIVRFQYKADRLPMPSLPALPSPVLACICS